MADTTLSLKFIKDEFVPLVATAHETVKAAIKQMGEDSDGDIGKMLEMQITMQGYTTLTELTSSVTKQVGDSIKGIVQKSG